MARIQLDVLYCGICHSDLHEAHEDWWPEHYPLVPGHEAQQGGYSDTFLVPEDYAIRIPEGADLKRVALLLCAGITTYSPLRFAGVKAGDRVGIAGFGGLGHMAVQYAVALGAKVTVFDFGGQFGIVGIPAFKEVPSLSLDKFIMTGGRRVFGSMPQRPGRESEVPLCDRHEDDGIMVIVLIFRNATLWRSKWHFGKSRAATCSNNIKTDACKGIFALKL